MAAKKPATQLLLVDYGSQYTHKFARKYLKQGIRAQVISHAKVGKWLKEYDATRLKGIVLSGGSASVLEADAPKLLPQLVELGVPMLAVCLGMQRVVYDFGGVVESNEAHREYAEAKVTVLEPSNPLLKGMPPKFTAWMSHGDSVTKLSPGFTVIAQSEGSSAITAIWDEERKIGGFQFHPEVDNTESGETILTNFANLCGCTADWDPRDLVEEKREEIREIVRKHGPRVVVPSSYGVDSSDVLALVASVVGKDALALYIHTGAQAEGEVEAVRQLAESLGASFEVVYAAERFQQAIVGWFPGPEPGEEHPKSWGKWLGNVFNGFWHDLRQTNDPEKGRIRFKGVYNEILEEKIRAWNAGWLAQGTNAADQIESAKKGDAAHIKSHHNMGMVLSVPEFALLGEMFKDEIRELARKLGLPEEISERHPIPGPAYFLRVLGRPPTPARLGIVAWAHAETAKILRKHGLMQEFSQLVVYLNCVPTVGVKGDGRTEEYTITVRGLVTADFMTGDGYQIPDYVRREITTRLIKHKHIVRVTYDETPKPPATTEPK